MGIVDGVMTLTANITKPSKDETSMWSMMGDDMRSMVVINGKGPFPDLTTCDGLQFEAMMTSSEDDDTNTIDWDEFKYRVEFGYKKLPDSVFGFGYRADLVMQPPSQTAKDDSEVDNDNDDDADTDTTVVDIQKRSAELSSTPSSFTNVVIPFEEFTIDWNWNTGEINTSCEENEDSCPDEVTLKNMETMTISAVGNTNGVPVSLHIRSISGTGCDSDAVAAEAAAESSGNEATSVKETQWTCAAATSSDNDEIVIESMTTPSFNWMTQNDPVMGGESYSNIEMMEDDGVAIFTGEVKDVPFLGVPGFIQMESRGGKGTYPDVSCCDSLKLTVMGLEEYAGYRVSFGNARSKSGFFAMGYKADFDAPVNGEFVDIVIPFNMFSVEWDEATGDQIITCAEDPTVCPDIETLRNMKTIAIWGEGVGGPINLHVKSIGAVGCSSNNDGGDNDIPSGEIPPRTNEAIEAWKKQNAADRVASSSTSLSLFGGICTIVASTLFVAVSF